MRNERRENNLTGNWREEVEDRLLKKPKKKYKSWTEELNLDNLSLLGPQWWVVRVSRVSGQETAERLARALIRNFPDIEFKVYAPAVQVKRKLKNGSYSIKPKPIFPGCAFLRCVLNKEMHDFIRECDLSDQRLEILSDKLINQDQYQQMTLKQYSDKQKKNRKKPTKLSKKSRKERQLLTQNNSTQALI